jgi:hypothetical protein
MMRKIVLAVATCVVAAGCAMPIGTPRPSMPVLEELRSSGIEVMQVGSFAPDKSLKSGDGGIGLRAMSISSPVNGSWSAYLGETVKVNLAAAGKLDDKAPLKLEGLLTESDVGTGLPQGHATLGAKFTLTRNGTTVFDRHVVVQDAWPSSFIGAEAIPDASNHYVGLYSMLALKLFSDPDFKAAAKAQ